MKPKQDRKEITKGTFAYLLYLGVHAIVDLMGIVKYVGKIVGLVCVMWLIIKHDYNHFIIDILINSVVVWLWCDFTLRVSKWLKFDYKISRIKIKTPYEPKNKN